LITIRSTRDAISKGLHGTRNGNRGWRRCLCATYLCSTLDIVGKPRYNVSNPKIARSRDFLLAIEAKARGVADLGNRSGYMGLSAHLAGKPVVLRLMDAYIISVVVESRREHR